MWTFRCLKIWIGRFLWQWWGLGWNYLIGLLQRLRGRCKVWGCWRFMFYRCRWLGLCWVVCVGIAIRLVGMRTMFCGFYRKVLLIALMEHRWTNDSELFLATTTGSGSCLVCSWFLVPWWRIHRRIPWDVGCCGGCWRLDERCLLWW
ncbi:hypothetical protein [Candidatus Hodgkinia cicadicola]|uniref:hypothetical protein n=1 Tax=Candidatus Hodgkinia cicadicola TaxID=573658 RepID=UPI001788A557